MRAEMRFGTKWTLVFLSIYMEVSLFRATCFPLIYHDNNWKESLNVEMKIVKKNFKEMTKTIEIRFKGSKEQEQILNGLMPITTVMDTLRNVNDQRFGFDKVVKRLNLLAELGDRLFAKMTEFATTLTMLNHHQFNDNDHADLTIKYELHKMSKFFTYIAQDIKTNDLLLVIQNDIIREKLISILNKLNQLKKVFISFTDKPDMNNKDVLRHECNATNGMKDVLTDLHIEIVNKDGNNGTFNELLNGGVSVKDNFELKVFNRYQEKGGVNVIFGIPPPERKYSLVENIIALIININLTGLSQIKI